MASAYPKSTNTAKRSTTLLIEQPELADGAALWNIARDSKTLDLNSSYAYLLWTRDFRRTSVVARKDNEAIGFVTGYRIPDRPDTLMIWQVAVAAAHRGAGVAGSMLDALLDRVVPDGVTQLETTITGDNVASIRLFTALAQRWAATLERDALFHSTLFPDGHATEDLYRIGPLHRSSWN